MTITITKDNFASEVLESSIPVLADFWADWCPPCKAIAPILEEISKEYEGKIQVAKINVDNNQELAQEYNIISIPTLVLFSGKTVVKKQVGAVSKELLVEFLSDVV